VWASFTKLTAISCQKKQKKLAAISPCMWASFILFFFGEYVGFFYRTHGFNMPSFIAFSNHMDKKFMWSSFISLSLANTVSDPTASPLFGKVTLFNKLL
jgi:hypothetical protein